MGFSNLNDWNERNLGQQQLLQQRPPLVKRGVRIGHGIALQRQFEFRIASSREVRYTIVPQIGGLRRWRNFSYFVPAREHR